MTDDLAGEDAGPAAPVEHGEEVGRLQEAMDRLPEADRQILQLRHYADMPFKDIARTLDCPIGTVLARAHRALGKLRSFMDTVRI